MRVIIKQEQATTEPTVELYLEQRGDKVWLVDARASNLGNILSISKHGVEITAWYQGNLPYGRDGKVVTEL